MSCLKKSPVSEMSDGDELEVEEASRCSGYQSEDTTCERAAPRASGSSSSGKRRVTFSFSVNHDDEVFTSDGDDEEEKSMSAFSDDSDDEGGDLRPLNARNDLSLSYGHP